MKKALVVLVVMGMLTVWIAACGGGRSPGVSSPTTQPDVVHMNDSQFVQSTITIKKGERITLIDDVSTLHVIANGTWQSDGLPRYNQEPGAPKVAVQFTGKESRQIGPFPTAGTFHLYCTVHQGMSLTVVVQ